MDKEDNQRRAEKLAKDSQAKFKRYASWTKFINKQSKQLGGYHSLQMKGAAK